MHVKVKALPECAREVLASVGYAREDIGVQARETFSVAHYGLSQGRRGFCILLDLSTGTHKMFQGSWGGANMFNPDNAVDLDNTQRPLPPGMLVIRGSEGNGTWADIECSPVTLAPLLPQATVALTDREVAILCAYRSLTSAGRKNEFERWPAGAPSEGELDGLAARGLLKRSKNGATQITTEGKNAVVDKR